MTRRVAFVALAAAAAVGACRPDDQETGSLSREDVQNAREQLPAEVREALDSGNLAYSARDYEKALAHFRRATEVDEDVAAGWFGIYMAQLALGNVDEAEAAMDRARGLAPGASLIHPDTAGAMPAPADSGEGTP